jgi:hypothetical protein
MKLRHEILERRPACLIDRSCHDLDALRMKFFFDFTQDLSVLLAVRSSGQQKSEYDILAFVLIEIESLAIESLCRPRAGLARNLLGETRDC